MNGAMPSKGFGLLDWSCIPKYQNFLLSGAILDDMLPAIYLPVAIEKSSQFSPEKLASASECDLQLREAIKSFYVCLLGTQRA